LEIALHHTGTGSTILAVARFAQMHEIEHNLSRVSLSIYVIAKLLSKWYWDCRFVVVFRVYIFIGLENISLYFTSSHGFRRDVNRPVWVCVWGLGGGGGGGGGGGLGRGGIRLQLIWCVILDCPQIWYGIYSCPRGLLYYYVMILTNNTEMRQGFI